MPTLTDWGTLAATFHALREPLMNGLNPQGLDAWAVENTEPYDGVREAAQFVLHLWDSAPGAWKCGDFHLRRSWGAWDDDHQWAFKLWASKPRFF